MVAAHLLCVIGIIVIRPIASGGSDLTKFTHLGIPGLLTGCRSSIEGWVKFTWRDQCVHLSIKAAPFSGLLPLDATSLTQKQQY